MRTILNMETLNHYKVKRLTVYPIDARITRRLCKKQRWEKHFKSSGNASNRPDGAVYGNPPVSAGDTDSISGLGGFHKLRGNWACAPGLLSTHSRAQELQLLKPTYLEPVVHSKTSHHNEECPVCHSWRKQGSYDRNPLSYGSQKDGSEPVERLLCVLTHS